MKLTYLARVLVFCTIHILSNTGCNTSSGNSADNSSETSTQIQKSATLSSFAPGESNLRFNLTDAPNPDVKSVYVNIDHIELKIGSSPNYKNIKIAENFGEIDLLTLQNGVILPLEDITVPNNQHIKQIRFVLKDSGNYLIKSDNSICDLQTPSQQQSGLKIIMNKIVNFEPGVDYSLTVDFDALKSIVFKGNGGCLLKPVLKIGAFSKTQESDVNNDGTSENEDDVLGEEDSNNNEGQESEPGVDEDSNESNNDDSNNDENIQDPDLDNDPDVIDEQQPSGGSGENPENTETIVCADIDFDPFDEATWPDGITEDDLAHCF